MWLNNVENIIFSLNILQDANVFVSEMKPCLEFDISLNQNRQAYMVCIEGSLEINGTSLGMRDGVEISAPTNDEMDLKITAGENGAHFLIIEMNRQDNFRM